MEKTIDVKQVVKNLKNMLEIKEDKELAQILGVEPQTLSEWKRNHRIENMLHVIHRKIEIDYHKLITGKSYEVKESQIYQEIDEYTKTVRKPDGEIIEEKRKSFRKPYVKQIVEKIDNMENYKRLKILEIIDLMVDNESGEVK